MSQYPALIDGDKGAYGVTFPDLPGIVAMGSTIEEAMAHAEQALRDYATEASREGSVLGPPTAVENVEVPHGHALVSVPPVALAD
ncbi:MAG: type II toxin-antitoxin system HicB family antitoxin [Bryobacterales bacterium]|nr:type II toxin-antitoxin system HicB family antitoxin [Bryobacterales bacterium]MDE0624151.1 type II toxin-antitoxin system HicB family antitoxin [Bryobacterales bacterium]